MWERRGNRSPHSHLVIPGFLAGPVEDSQGRPPPGQATWRSVTGLYPIPTTENKDQKRCQGTFLFGGGVRQRGRSAPPEIKRLRGLTAILIDGGVERFRHERSHLVKPVRVCPAPAGGFRGADPAVPGVALPEVLPMGSGSSSRIHFHLRTRVTPPTCRLTQASGSFRRAECRTPIWTSCAGRTGATFRMATVFLNSIPAKASGR